MPIADGSEEMEATIIIDILRRAKANVVVASVGNNLEILASRKVRLVADMLLDEAAKLSHDLIVLPVWLNSVMFLGSWFLPSFLFAKCILKLGIAYFQGGLGGAQAFANSDKLVNLLKKQAELNKPYGAICASPALVLEPHGLLKV